MKAREESGQALIFFGIMMPVLMLVLGVVVEGGFIVTKYRQMQAAADMAALTAAQILPCDTTDTTCIGNAEARGCQYAADNGFGDCAAGGASGSFASVPPQTCSPYDTINYGNDTLNPNCKSSSVSVQNYDYVEVHLAWQVRVPIFNAAFTLTAHAVARHGQVSPRRFAIEVLDPTMSKALNLSGSSGGGLITVGPVISDSTASDSIYTGGSSTQVTCSGQWYTAANEVVPPGGPASGVTSNTNGTALFAPPSCTGGALDSPTRFLTNVPPVPDPYSSSAVPTGNMPGCAPCNQIGWVYSWTTGNRSSGTWTSADNLHTLSGGQNYEFFPGIYPNTVAINGGEVYFNPGVYTLEAGLSTTGGDLCIYGAPACDHQISLVNSQANCSNVSFNNGDSTYVSSDAWYYYCSPWGIWDSSSLPGRPVTTTPPTFTDGTPLNGITFYLQAGNITLKGNGSSYLAFPNPCPGTGDVGSAAVSWPAGNSVASYAYPSGSLPATDGVTGSPAGQVYPSGDFSYSAECRQAQPPDPRNVWNGEMDGQHLHFLVFSRSTSSSISLNGTSLQNWWGIIYNPGTPGCGTSCTISINGTGGSGVGPPLLSGQIVADNATFTGNAHFEVYYSPCRPDGDVCSVGYGTSLVQ